MGSPAEKEIYKCQYCDSQISVLTKKLQSQPTASLTWWKHGVCSASCSSTKVINNSISKSNKGMQAPGYDFKSGIDPASEFTAVIDAPGPEETAIIKACRRRKIACHTVLITGKILQFCGVLGGILLFYSYKPISALYGLAVFLAGLIMIRMSKFFSMKLSKSMAAMLDRKR